MMDEKTGIVSNNQEWHFRNKNIDLLAREIDDVPILYPINWNDFRDGLCPTFAFVETFAYYSIVKFIIKDGSKWAKRFSSG
mmetsp:Transcript_27204/g.58287  ORF Transcript_27204/g.58287 Transcript_27204/m.58287 type:complete len:81 (+) Transcript_27204:1436-1678(+)